MRRLLDLAATVKEAAEDWAGHAVLGPSPQEALERVHLARSLRALMKEAGLEPLRLKTA